MRIERRERAKSGGLSGGTYLALSDATLLVARQLAKNCSRAGANVIFFSCELFVSTPLCRGCSQYWGNEAAALCPAPVSPWLLKPLSVIRTLLRDICCFCICSAPRPGNDFQLCSTESLTLRLCSVNKARPLTLERKTQFHAATAETLSLKFPIACGLLSGAPFYRILFSIQMKLL